VRLCSAATRARVPGFSPAALTAVLPVLDPGHSMIRLVRSPWGSIVLLHDGLSHPTQERYVNRQPMHEAITMVLQQLDGRFRFVTIPELIQIVSKNIIPTTVWITAPATFGHSE
jgi:hypothetical protein